MSTWDQQLCHLLNSETTILLNNKTENVQLIAMNSPCSPPLFEPTQIKKITPRASGRKMLELRNLGFEPTVDLRSANGILSDPIYGKSSFQPHLSGRATAKCTWPDIPQEVHTA